MTRTSHKAFCGPCSCMGLGHCKHEFLGSWIVAFAEKTQSWVTYIDSLRGNNCIYKQEPGGHTFLYPQSFSHCRMFFYTHSPLWPLVENHSHKPGYIIGSCTSPGVDWCHGITGPKTCNLPKIVPCRFPGAVIAVWDHWSGNTLKCKQMSRMSSGRDPVFVQNLFCCLHLSLI